MIKQDEEKVLSQEIIKIQEEEIVKLKQLKREYEMNLEVIR